MVHHGLTMVKKDHLKNKRYEGNFFISCPIFVPPRGKERGRGATLRHGAQKRKKKRERLKWGVAKVRDVSRPLVRG